MKRKIYYLALILGIALFVHSCSDDDSEIEKEQQAINNIVETAQETDALSSLVAALLKADEKGDSDLVGILSGNGPFTVFAPTNEAFATLLGQLEGYNSLDDFTTDEDKEVLATILKYHVVSGIAADSGSLQDGQEITTVQGEKVQIGLNGGVSISDATDVSAAVVLPDVEADNGIVHVIDKVLLPQAIIDALNAEEFGTLVDVVVSTESLSILKDAVIKADLVDILGSEGPFTVFAPTNDAFIALLDVLGDDYNGLDDFDTEEEMQLLKDILLFHVIAGTKVMSTDLAEGEVATAFEGNSIDVIAANDGFVIGDASQAEANIAAPDVMASNGVAHVIDKVLLPQSAIDFVVSMSMKNIVEIAIETDDLSILVSALQHVDAGLVELLAGDGPFTVFAPTNQAFIDLLAALGEDYNGLDDFDTEAEVNLLIKVLKYHVVAGIAAYSTDLSDGMTIEMACEDTISVKLDGGVFIQDATEVYAQVVLPDVEATNGVVHVIDKVLLPQVAVDYAMSLSLKNIVEIAIETDDLSVLVSALQYVDAGLVALLAGEGPFTVFAPTNQAFTDLLGALGNEYNALADFNTEDEIALLVDILKYHVVVGVAAFSGDLVDGSSIETATGDSVMVNLTGGVFIQDATGADAEVVLADVEASNGAVHVINKVLLHQEAVDFAASMH
jgi:uncharacterized surface protein with fasciclin (FAS1) repeats